ncbi:Golgi-associated kinase 1A isoform X2 [Melanotaenia boesemani]|uniref:Golgi-associated kinase 1A isoform X2 n=1 Tax=Melanotaenia boesemani TaxID=1250792 RepID=UPI001C04A618|nr:Golgi-associated kinase 1A isoform X2 [Melanotaenia boesemani]
MGWRVWSKFCCGHKLVLLLSPLFILFLMVLVTTITLPPPLPPTDIDRRSSRALSSAGEFRSRPRIVDPPPAAVFQQPNPHIRSSTWKLKTGKAPSKYSPASARNDKNGIEARGHVGIHRNKHRGKDVGFQSVSHYLPHFSDFTVNNHEPKLRIKLGKHSTLVQHTAQAYINLGSSKSTAPHSPYPADAIISGSRAANPLEDRRQERHINRNSDRQIHGNRRSHQALERHRQVAKHSGKSDSVFLLDPTKDPTRSKKNPGSLNPKKASSQPEVTVKKDHGDWCQSFTEQRFPESDHRRIRVGRNLQLLPWLSGDDIQKMELLAGGEVISKARVPSHGQVLQVALHPPGQNQHGAAHEHPATHIERCRQGFCSLIKRTDDWFEVFAFHLDRVLGLNRSLPAVLRTFHSDVLPYRYISGTPRPAVWWDPDIQHLTDEDNDQNSVPLSWVQYQKLLQARCGNKTDLRSEPCVGVPHSDWEGLALYDFLLQVNDRLDRYCCGFIPSPAELCVENLLHAKCGNIKDLLLVHILVRAADPSRLVFIDNAGRPQQSIDNLNFRLVEGIDAFPEKAVSVLRSGCLESLLLHSLYTDKEFWDSRGGASGLRPLIRTVEERGQILLQYVKEKKLQLKRDL